MTGTRAQFQGGADELVIDFDPDTIVGSDDDAVATWLDTSSRFAWNAVTGRSPVLKTAILNGHQVLRSDGTKAMIAQLSGLFRQAAACYIVVGNLSASAYTLFDTGYLDDWSRFSNTLSYPSAFRSARLENVNGGMPASGSFIQVVRSSDSEYSFGKAGSVATGLTPSFKADFLDINATTIEGRRYTLFAASATAGGIDKPATCDIGFIRFANFLPSAAVEAKWIADWQTKYGL